MCIRLSSFSLSICLRLAISGKYLLIHLGSISALLWRWRFGQLVTNLIWQSRHLTDDEVRDVRKSVAALLPTDLVKHRLPRSERGNSKLYPKVAVGNGLSGLCKTYQRRADIALAIEIWYFFSKGIPLAAR